MKSLRFVYIVLAVLLCSSAPAFAVVKVKSLCELHYPSDARVEWECLKLKWKDTPAALFGEQWQDVLRFNRMDRRHFLGDRSIKVPKRLEEIKDFTPLPATYPDAATTKIPSNGPPNRVQVVVAYPYEPFFGLGWPTVTVNAAAEGRIMN